MRSRIILTAQLADAAAFGLAVGRVGIGGEANPLAALLYGVGGLGGVLTAKVAGAVLLAWVGPRLGAWWLLPAVAGIAGAATGLAVLA